MIEKKTMGYVDFKYPNYEAEAVTAIVNSETNEVEIYQSDDTSNEWNTPNMEEHFFPTVGEATEALEKHKKEMLAKMPEVKSYLEAMHNWYNSIKEKEKDKIIFNEKDYLPYRYQPDYDEYYKKRCNELNIENAYLLDIIRTGFINICGDTIKVEDVEQVKWGKNKAELCLKGGRKTKTCNDCEFSIIEKLFGSNHSSFTYTHLNDNESNETL